MAAFQILLQNYIQNKLDSVNAVDNTPFTYNLYNRYAIEDQDFYDVVLDSVDWEAEGSEGIPADNVVVEYDGAEYNTQNGQYTLEKIKYVPCIIEDFIADFEPLSFVENVSYTIPITFYINETFDKQLDNLIILGIQQFGNSLRGQTGTLFDPESGQTYKLLSNHTALTPLTGIIDFNGTVFREYQIVVNLELISNGFFGNQIQYAVSITDNDFVNPLTSQPYFSGQTFAVNPIAATSTRASELHGFQIFGDTNFESKSIPNEVGFMMELSFLYTGDAFTSWLYKQKFNPSPPKKISVKVTYPSSLLQSQEIPTVNYVIESIGGVEQVGEKIILTVVLKPVSVVY